MNKFESKQMIKVAKMKTKKIKYFLFSFFYVKKPFFYTKRVFNVLSLAH